MRHDARGAGRTAARRWACCAVEGWRGRGTPNAHCDGETRPDLPRIGLEQLKVGAGVFFLLADQVIRVVVAFVLGIGS
jgi:hypothetical protein